MKPNLSIILPSIRPYNLERLYNSILEATVESFELVVVGPYDLPKELRHYRNIKVFRDWGSPTRASQIGASLAEGKWITWAADDAVYLPNSIDNCLNKLNELNNPNAVISAKYLEGDSGSFSTNNQADSFYKLNSAYPNAPLINPNAYILNVGFMSRKLFETYGGWDCRFEACPLAHADLAARLQMTTKMHVILLNEYVLKCEHMPGESGDHKPVHNAQTYSDTQKYVEKWSCSEKCRSIIEMSNWKNANQIWNRRFSSDN